jgi:hypothetical protein
VLHDIKFYKSEFRDKILNVPEFRPYIADLLDAAMVMKNDDNTHPTLKGADTNSFEEMRKQEDEE